MAVVTISRGFGCPGEHVAKRIASKLEYSLINKEILEYISILSDTPIDVVKKFDEEEHSNMNAKLSKYLDLSIFKEMYKKIDDDDINKIKSQRLPENDDSIFSEKVGYSPLFDSDIFRNMVERVFKFLADKDNAVILGRGGQVVLRDYPNALHVRLFAPITKRAEWIASRDNISKPEALKQIEKVDKRRKNYLKHYYDSNIYSDELYHLIINVDKLSIAETADIILKLIDFKTPTETT